MFNLSRFGKFHKNDDQIGVELETTLVDENYKKPTESNFKKAFLETLNYTHTKMQKGINAMNGRDGKRKKQFVQTVAIHNLYEKLLENPSYEIHTSGLDLVKMVAFKDAEAMMRWGIKYCIDDFQKFAEGTYNKCVKTENEDRGLETIVDLMKSWNPKEIKTPAYEPELYVEKDGERKHVTGDDAKSVITNLIKNDIMSVKSKNGEQPDNESIYDAFRGKELTIKISNDNNLDVDLQSKKINKISFLKEMAINKVTPWVNALVGHSIASAYANRVLPTYVDITQGLSPKEKERITYDSSDAIEMITSPCRTVDDVRTELNGFYEKIKPELEKKGLNVLFAARLPDAKPTGWKERLGRGEPQNVFGMHVHFGRVNDEFEAGTVYEAYRRVAPEIMALTANSGVSSGEIVDAVSYRQKLYRNLIPEKVDAKPNMSGKEKRQVRKQMSELFGENSEFEQSSQHSLEGAIQDMLIEKGLMKKKNEKTDLVKGARAYSCVYMRPELGTIEVRMVDVQSDYDNNTLGKHIDANLYAVELIDAVGKATVEAYREGKELFSDRADLKDRYEIAIQVGLGNSTLQKDASNLLTMVEPYLSKETSQVLRQRVDEGASPAITQKKLFKKAGREGLYKQITTR